MINLEYNTGHKDVVASLATLTKMDITHMADSQDTKLIPLSQGKFAIVDAEYYNSLLKLKWYADNTGRKNVWYAKANTKNSSPIYMHRFILQAPKGIHVDHLNHNTLDNRKNNIRLCTVTQNRANELKRPGFTSSYKGVSACKQTGKWCVFIKINYKNKNLGRYDTETEAALVYNRHAKELFGEFALLNEVLL